MGRKVLLSLGLKFLCVVILSACTLRIKEPAPAQEQLKINNGYAGCLSDAGEVLQRYFDGKVSDQELNSFWSCLYSSLDLFMKNTVGASSEFYTPRELTWFLEKYFLNGKKIQPTLAREAMALKTAFLGGSSERLTKDEISKTIQIIKIFHLETLRLRPHLPIKRGSSVSFDADSSEAFERRVANLVEAMSNIGQALEKNVNAYSFDRFDALMRELEIFLLNGRPETTQWIRDARENLKLISTVKSILVGPPAEEISTGDFRRIFRLVPRYYALYLRASRYSNGDTSLLYGEGLDALDALVKDVQDTLLETLSYRSDALISFGELESLVDALGEQKLLPGPPEAVKELLRTFLTKIVPKETAFPSSGVSARSLDFLWKAFLSWSEGQRYLDNLFRELSGSPHPNSKTLTLSEIVAVPSERAFDWTKYRNEVSSGAIGDILEIVRNIRATASPLDPVVTITADRSVDYSFPHLSRLNLVRSLVGFVAPAYASSSAGVSKAELDTFFADVIPPASKLGIISSDIVKTIGDRFIEADLFLFGSNGDGFLNLYEILDLFAFGYSTVLKGEGVQRRISERCGVLYGGAKGEDHQGIEASCYKDAFLAGVGDFWSQVPGFLQFFQNQPNEVREWMLDRIDVLARGGDRGGARVGMGDSQAYLLIPYYLEAVIARYDTDLDGKVSDLESREAFPVFESFVAEKAKEFGLDRREDHEAVFTYLLKYEALPNESLRDKMRFARWRYVGQSSFSVDRRKLLGIFSKLMSL